MIKVFLVEDEFVVREGIKNRIDWQGQGFDFCGDAADGELAYTDILEKKPDIVITDIKMPFVDGIELSRLVKESLPKTRIIILSGYGEFEYAKEAIKIGVTEYLLKPINGHELVKVVQKVADGIKAEKVERDFLRRYEAEMQENRDYLQKKMFSDMMKGSLATAEIIKKGKDLGISLTAGVYKVVTYKFYNMSQLIQEQQCYDLETRIHVCIDKMMDVFVMEQSLLGMTFLLKENTEASLKLLEEEFIQHIEGILDEFQVSYQAGQGPVVYRLSQVAESYYGAAHMNDKKKASIDSRMTESYMFADPELEGVELSAIDFKLINDYLRHGDLEELEKTTDIFLDQVKPVSEKSVLLKLYIVMNLYITVSAFMKEMGCEEVLMDSDLADEQSFTYMASHFGQVRSFMIRLFRFALEHRNESREDGYNGIIIKAKEYLQDHYSDDALSLNQVAGTVGLSASHFSTVFRSVTGKTFIRYLTDIRIGKARELLKCSNMRCSEVGMAVGYKDPHYFSFLFKKELGISPVKYRSSKKAMAEVRS